MEQLITAPYHDVPRSDFHPSTDEDITIQPLQSTKLMQALVSNLDINATLATYRDVLTQWLPIKALSVKIAGDNLSCGAPLLNTSGWFKSHKVGLSDNQPYNLQYQLTQQLSDQQSWKLAQLHALAKPFINNAVEHYKVKKLALQDHLTGLGNRASFDDILAKMLSSANRNQQNFGLLLIDLDNFKQVNDTRGHIEGDKVIATMGQLLKNALRSSDYAFRFGGDEFACLLPMSNDPINKHIAQRIQSHVVSNDLLHHNRVTCSIGSVSFSAGDTEHCLFAKADDALYLAKADGRNCIKVA